MMVEEVSGSAAAEELEIAAVHERDRVVDQPVRRAPGVRVFPFDRGDTGMGRAQDDLGDVSWSTAKVVNVEGVEELDQAVPALCGQSQRLRQELDRLAAQMPHEARRDIAPKIVGCVGGEQDRGTRASIVPVQAKVQLTGTVGQDEFAAVIVGNDDCDRCDVERGETIEPGRRRFEDQCRG